jgi:hypothetical protein
MTAEKVIEALDKAEAAQGEADSSIAQATKDIENADADLTDVSIICQCSITLYYHL